MPDESTVASAIEAALEMTLDALFEPEQKPRRSRKNVADVQTWYSDVPTPIGQVTVVSENHAIVGVYMESHRHGPVDRDSWLPDVNEQCDVLNAARTQLVEYFSGQRLRFELRLAPTGTDVQHKVWRALSDIPFGETRSYGAIAAIIGSPKASRAVGAANGRNPISIIVPCHRVIGSNGALTGFGGGIERKEWLLNHEARISGKSQLYGTARRDLFSTDA